MTLVVSGGGGGGRGNKGDSTCFQSMREKGREGNCVWKTELSGAKDISMSTKNQNDDTHGFKNTKRYGLTISSI
jgi:hypothetical protein